MSSQAIQSHQMRPPTPVEAMSSISHLFYAASRRESWEHFRKAHGDMFCLLIEKEMMKSSKGKTLLAERAGFCDA